VVDGEVSHIKVDQATKSSEDNNKKSSKTEYSQTKQPSDSVLAILVEDEKSLAFAATATNQGSS
jgi:hypothetical protein